MILNPPLIAPNLLLFLWSGLAAAQHHAVLFPSSQNLSLPDSKSLELDNSFRGFTLAPDNSLGSQQNGGSQLGNDNRFRKLVQMQTTAGREIVVELQVHGEEAVAKEESLLLLREGEIPKDFSGGSFIKSQQLLRCQHCQVILPCDYIIDAALVFTNHYSTLPDPLPEIIKLHASVKQSHLDLKFIIRDETGNSPPEVMMEFIDLQQFLFLDVIEVQRLPSHRPTPEEIVKHSRQRTALAEDIPIQRHKITERGFVFLSEPVERVACVFDLIKFV